MPSTKDDKNKSKPKYGDFYSESSSYQKHINRTKKKNSKENFPKKLFNTSIIVLSIIFALVGAGMLYAYNLINSFNYENDIESPSLESKLSNTDEEITGELRKEGSLLKDPKVLNIMLFGLDDQSAGDNGRTDTMLMLSIDNRHKKLKLSTFMRDIWVQIPGHGHEKLNAAFAFGGAKLAVETIERTFGVNIDRYAMAHFDGFADIVESLGGIDMYLTKDEAIMVNKLCDREGMPVPKKLIAEDGVQHLCGFQALNHARNRDSAGSDFDRTKRQRDVLSKIIEKTKTANMAQILSMIKSIAPKITMNFTKDEVAKLASNALTYVHYSVEEFRLPENDNYTDKIEANGAAALEIDNLKKARYDLAKFLYEESLQTVNTPE